MDVKEVSESYTFQTRTGYYGGFCIKRSVRERLRLRWNVDPDGQVGFVLRAASGEILYEGSRLINESYMVNPTKDLQDYLTDYAPVEVTIRHYLDGRKRDLDLEVRLLVEKKNLCRAS